MKKFLISSAILGYCLATYPNGGNNQIISINELFELAETNSKALKLSDLVSQEKKEEINVAKNALLPTLDISLSAGYLSDIRISDRNFGNGFTVQMKNFGDYANFTNKFVAEASQIIYAGGAIKSSIKNAELNYQASQFEKEQTRQNIRFMLLSYYLELYRLSNQELVYLHNIEQTQKLVADIRNKHKEGIALKNDITRHELQLQSLLLKLTHTRNCKSVTNNKLCTLLNLDKSTTIEIDKNILNDLPVYAEEETWQAAALDSSPKIKTFETYTQQALNAEKIVNAERLPKIFIFASDVFEGPVTIDMDVKDNNMNIWTVGIGLKYNLASLYTTNKSVRQSKIAYQAAVEAENMIKDDIQTEINSAFVMLNEAFTILKTRETSLELATQNYEVINNRYLNDLALITDMLDASNSKLESELQMADAKINILFSFFNLKRCSGQL